MFAHTPDGLRLAYDTIGQGPPLLLLQGLDETRAFWQGLGYVQRLHHAYTVITMDRRGIGDSDKPSAPDAYDVTRLRADVLAVLDACGVERALLWGHSFGGSIGLQLAARSDRVIRAVIGGSFFGRVYPEERVDPIIAWWEKVARARAAGELDTLNLDPEEAAFVVRTDLGALIACWRALPSWPTVEPRQMRCPVFLYAGAADERVAAPLRMRRPVIEAAGHMVRVFDGLDHEQEVRAIDVVLPPALTFLQKAQPSSY